MDDAWGTIKEIVTWLDDSSTLPPETEKLLRIMKLTEEAGEVTQAVTGTLGQNPRKGVTHTWEDVQAELCDVIFTAMVALITLTPDARQTFHSHLARVADRSLSEPSTPRPSHRTASRTVLPGQRDRQQPTTRTTVLSCAEYVALVPGDPLRACPLACADGAAAQAQRPERPGRRFHPGPGSPLTAGRRPFADPAVAPAVYRGPGPAEFVTG